MNAEPFILDFAHLKSLTGEDNEFMIEILELIIEQSPGVLDEMYQQLESKDFVALGATAHKYKSSINILGNTDLINLMKDIEDNACLAPEQESLVDLVNHFRGVCDQLLDALGKEIGSLKID